MGLQKWYLKTRLLGMHSIRFLVISDILFEIYYWFINKLIVFQFRL